MHRMGLHVSGRRRSPRGVLPRCEPQADDQAAVEQDNSCKHLQHVKVLSEHLWSNGEDSICSIAKCCIRCKGLLVSVRTVRLPRC